MKQQILFLLFLITFCTLHAQKEASVWYFGWNAGVDFNTGAPVTLTDGELSTDEGCATISDPNGNLMFYTDGITVWNRNHMPMPNGTGLKGDPSSTQSAIIVPKSDESNIFYIFTVDNIGGPDGLQYNVVDMNLDGGMGDVTALKNILLHTPVSEKVTAVEHANGNAIWVVTKGWLNNSFLSFLVDATGVSTTPVVSNIGFTTVTGPVNREAHGYLKASPNGEFLAAAYFSRSMAEICRFDTNTGVVSDWVSLQDFLDDEWYYEQPYGVEFSPNSNILYVGVQGGVLQFDVSNYNQAAILASGTMISPLNSSPPFLGALQTAIDGKIYVTRAFRRYLNVINDPNVLGMGSNYQEQAVNLGPTARGVLGLPPFLTSYFDVGIQAENFCLGAGTDFSVNASEPITTISWDFGDGNTSILEAPTHTYLTPGDYTVNVTVTTATETSSDTREITIYETPVANAVIDFEVCTTSPTFTFDLSTKDTEVLGTQTPSDFQVTYFPTLIDAENNTNALPNLYTNTLATETIFARIQNIGNPACFDTTSFDLVIQKAPVVNTQEDWTVCDTDLDGFHTFDLSQKTTSILQNNDPADFNVSYYLSQADLDNKTNPIAINYTNTVAIEEIFWRIENNSHPTCYGEGTFFLEVISGVTANSPANFEVCDDDNDGLYSFDLTHKESEVLGGQNSASILVSYHPSLIDAENDSSPLSNNYTNSTLYNETIFVRVENIADPNCYDTTSFQLQITDSPMVQPVTDWRVCDDDNDGSYLFDLQSKEAEILGNQSNSDFSISFYETQADADANANNIVGLYGNTSNPQTVFYRIENNNNSYCYLTESFELEVSRMPMAYTPTEITICDTNETGTQTIDLSIKDGEVLGGQSSTTFVISYFSSEMDAINHVNALPKNTYANTSLQETIYARIQNSINPECYDISEFEINIRPLPQLNLEEQYVICPDSPELTIDGGDFESWSWQDEDNNPISTARYLNVSSLGIYSLTVSHSPNGLTCDKTVSFEVVSSGAPEDFTTELSGFSDLITVEIDVLGIGDFEYSVDGENFQENNRLEVFPGTHTIYVRDMFLCRTISKEIIALGYQKFFTPNGDGSHDYWNIFGVENFPNSEIYIFDRYGKLLSQLSPTSPGWDGTFQGTQMPSSDYWFRFINEDGNIHTGHFSLKR